MRYAYELVDTFNLDPKKKISSLSQGMRAQTALIGALAHRPQLLILDEPSNGLDVVVRLDIIDAIIRTVADEGRSEVARGWPALPGVLSLLHRLPCPTITPWAAECWLEFRRHALPILLLALGMSLLVPLLHLSGRTFDMPGAQELAAILPLLLYFAGIGIALVNRRMAHGGYMNAFEAARPFSTQQQAATQILMTALAIALGMACIDLALHLSAPLTTGMREPWLRLGSLIAPLPQASLAVAAANQLMEVLLFLSVIALFSCLHACAVFWGRRVLIAVVMVLFYCLALAARIPAEQAGLPALFPPWWAC